MSPPRVSVLTAARNRAAFLPATLESVLAQTFGDFEYLVVDDASTDESAALVADYARRDKRIRLIRNAHRLGAAGAFNIAVGEAQGDYLAMLDGDDLALPERLTRQVAFLDAHPDFGAVGCQLRLIDPSGNLLGVQPYPSHPAVARWTLLFGTSLLNSATSFRRALLQSLGGCSLHHGYLHDYELAIRVAERARIGNLEEELGCYRKHAEQMSVIDQRPQTGQMLLLQYALQFRWLGLRPRLEVFGALRNWVYGSPPSDAALAAAAVTWLHTLFATYVERFALGGADHQAVAESCARQWARMAHHGHGPHPELSQQCWREARRLNPALSGDLATRRWLRKRPRASSVERSQTPGSVSGELAPGSPGRSD